MELGRKLYTCKIISAENVENKIYLEDIGGIVSFISSVYNHLCFACFYDHPAFLPIRQNLLKGRRVDITQILTVPDEFRIEVLSVSYESPLTLKIKPIYEIWEVIKEAILQPSKVFQEQHKTRLLELKVEEKSITIKHLEKKLPKDLERNEFNNQIHYCPVKVN